MKPIVLFCFVWLALTSTIHSQPTAVGPGQIIKDKQKTLGPATFPQDCPPSGSIIGIGSNAIPQTETRTLNGVSFVIKTARFVQNNQVCLTTDLYDLQSRMHAIIGTKNVPTNNCASYVMPNPVVTIQGSTLAPGTTAGELKFTMTGYVTPWACGPGPPITHSEWVNGSCCPVVLPHHRFWMTPGPDTKVPGASVSFTEEIWYTLAPHATSKVKAWAGANSKIPVFSPAIPAIDMTSLVESALNAALPTFPHAQAPLVNVQGQRYINNRSQIWGTF